MASRFHSITMNRFLDNGLTSTSNALSHRSVPLLRQASHSRKMMTVFNRFTACYACNREVSQIYDISFYDSTLRVRANCSGMNPNT